MWGRRENLREGGCYCSNQTPKHSGPLPDYITAAVSLRISASEITDCNLLFVQKQKRGPERGSDWCGVAQQRQDWNIGLLLLVMSAVRAAWATQSYSSLGSFSPFSIPGLQDMTITSCFFFPPSDLSVCLLVHLFVTRASALSRAENQEEESLVLCQGQLGSWGWDEETEK